jgi:hypothetical protein
MSRGILPVLVLGALLAVSTPARADVPREPLVDQVRKAIDQGITYLKSQEHNGRWETDGYQLQYQGGGTALALLALLNAGVKPDEPVIQRGLKYLRDVEPKATYVVGLQTMVFAEARQAEDRPRIQRNVRWLLDARSYDNRHNFHGWWYAGHEGRAGGSDNSNTQYAVLGLWAAATAGVPIERAVWQQIRDYYLNCQSHDGTWSYVGQPGAPGRLTMTSAGLCGLVIASQQLNDRREVPQADGQAMNCGMYKDDDAIKAAQRWIGDHFRLQDAMGVFYNLYGLERAGRLSGQRFLGEHDWYREGCDYLVRIQDPIDGSWHLRGSAHYDNWPIVSTSFALLFLSKGRTPVLVTKMVHGPGDDWNNDRNDAFHLVTYAGKELFQNKPMAWQVYDTRRVELHNEEDILTLTADLLQSPVVYITGHEAPQFSDNEKKLLQKYVEQGGFIMADACCGRKAFDTGFRALMKELFPQNPLKPLPKDHPLWKAHADLAGVNWPLEGVEWGCKTAIVYSPLDLSCAWEQNKQDDARVLFAFRLGGNILAYATGLEPPKPRLTQIEVTRTDPEDKDIPRGTLQIAQLRCSGERPAPQAVRNLMLHLRHHARLLVALQSETVDPDHKDLIDFKFMYMHGRGAPMLKPEEIKNLRANLETGGLLFADACCGSKAFDEGFRKLVEQVLPGKKLEVIRPSAMAPLDLFSKEINGEAIQLVRCRREGAGQELRDVAPFLEGIQLNNRWVVIYSKYDIGCALETPQGNTPAGCLGHDYASAVKLASAAVLYALKR